MEIVLYASPTCPKCKVLAAKLEKKGATFTKEMDEEKIIAKGFKSIPWLEVDGELMDFGTANDWINTLEV